MHLQSLGMDFLLQNKKQTKSIHVQKSLLFKVRYDMSIIYCQLTSKCWKCHHSEINNKYSKCPCPLVEYKSSLYCLDHRSPLSSIIFTSRIFSIVTRLIRPCNSTHAGGNNVWSMRILPPWTCVISSKLTSSSLVVNRLQ